MVKYSPVSGRIGMPGWAMAGLQVPPLWSCSAKRRSGYRPDPCRDVAIRCAGLEVADAIVIGNDSRIQRPRTARTASSPCRRRRRGAASRQDQHTPVATLRPGRGGMPGRVETGDALIDIDDACRTADIPQHGLLYARHPIEATDTQRHRARRRCSSGRTGPRPFRENDQIRLQIGNGAFVSGSMTPPVRATGNLS